MIKAHSINGYHPISFCNFAYKVVSNIITNEQKLMDHLVSLREINEI